ncbi:MAG: beta-lactamase family protein, partial [Pirellulaceae bacterium]|nr:beta-lactamase family protein [Pirellulaceae bacterium]
WESIDHRAVGYRTRRGRVVRSTDTDVSWKLGGGGYLSNIGDMAAYAAGLINGRLVSKATEQAMWTVQETSDGRMTGRGLGFFLGSCDGAMEVSHNGAQEKTKTRLVIYPRERNGIVFMTNSEYANPTRFVEVVQRALDETPGDMLVGPSPTDSCESRRCRPIRPRRPCAAFRLRHGRCARCK